MDFQQLEFQYPAAQGGPGRPPYHPRLMTALRLYGMCEGMETAAAIAEACALRVDFMCLAGGLHPVDQTLLNFLRRSLDALASIWLQLLQAMDKAGLISLELIVEVGTKLRVNASPRSFRTMERITGLLTQLRTRLAAHLEQMVAHPENVDRTTKIRLSALPGLLARTGKADAELRNRTSEQTDLPERQEEAAAQPATPKMPPEFSSADFRPHPEQDALLCPADKELI